MAWRGTERAAVKGKVGEAWGSARQDTGGCVRKSDTGP